MSNKTNEVIYSASINSLISIANTIANTWSLSSEIIPSPIDANTEPDSNIPLDIAEFLSMAFNNRSELAQYLSVDIWTILGIGAHTNAWKDNQLVWDMMGHLGDSFNLFYLEEQLDTILNYDPCGYLCDNSDPCSGKI